DVENYIEQNSTRSAKLDPFSVWYVSSILMMDQWTTTFYIQNVLNEEGITATFPDSYMTSDSSQGYNGTGQKDFIINPRTIGVELTYSFE
ncbi:MAG: hypothetical protein HRU21_08785, partial [Pseudomonadales bacterium]|nr:hypothetical protein [Pseudomonadales bacterium]